MRTKRDALTQERLKELLHYNPETGVFTWKMTRHKFRIGMPAGHLMDNGYVIIFVNQGQYLAHRLAWLFIHGRFPSEMLDHVNGVRNDNRISNIREASRSENFRNTPVRKDNVLGVKGVSWRPRENRFYARVWTGKKPVGAYFKTLEEAVVFATEQRNKLHGEFANHG